MEKFLNYRLLGNPINWLTLAVWLLAIAYFAHAAGFLKDSPGTPEIFPVVPKPETQG